MDKVTYSFQSAPDGRVRLVISDDEPAPVPEKDWTEVEVVSGEGEGS
jgi:hypothetical protein